MTKSIDIIFLWRQADWGFYKRRNEAILFEISKKSEVCSILHCEPITIKSILQYFYRLLFSTMRKQCSVQIKKALFLKPLQVKNENNIYITSVICFASNHKKLGRIFGYVNDFFVNCQLRIIKKYFQNNSNSLVLIVYPPVSYLNNSLEIFNYTLLIADLVDDVIARTDDEFIKQEYIENYKNILPRCNYIFSTGQSLKRYENIARQPIYVLPNGVNFSEFNKKRAENGSVIKERKIAGYVGSINHTMDVDLVEFVINDNPTIDFVIYGFCDSIGRVYIKKLKKIKNFYYMGPVVYTAVPEILCSFDVLISFKKKSKDTIGGDSIKLYEYLATGKPIVTTPVSPADRFESLVYIADEPKQFSKCLRKAISENDELIIMKRKTIAKKNSWARMTDIMWNKILELI
jgi:glycosyltransferase involved in cell wall biosynthesis